MTSRGDELAFPVVGDPSEMSICSGITKRE
ncbi:hypothetical protein LCGC14_1129910 [marine sediment metagenome]|uniref:Uncharacterized protein n=1 Tax=marine sediment metagenome TaxID=412755 RepID=A0A0F9MP77_9ZZZZ